MSSRGFQAPAWRVARWICAGRLRTFPRVKFPIHTLRAAVLLCALAPVARAQQSPNKEPLPMVEPLPANPEPAGVEPPALMPDEIVLTPRPTAADGAGPIATPFKLHLEPLVFEPVLPALAPGWADERRLASALRVQVKRFVFKGNHVISTRTLQKAVAPFSNREVTSSELEEARQAVTAKYVEAGYINSGAVLPDQDLKDGVIALEVIEGRLTSIELSGYFWMRPWWLRHELRRAAGKPLNFNNLKEGLQLLRQDPNIRQINAELMPGGKPGESILKADVKEVQPFRLGVEVSNRRPPSVGSEIVDVSAADLNLTGHSDPLFLKWGAAHAVAETADRWEFSDLQNLEGSYRFPITPWHTTLEVHASRNDSSIVEEQFSELNITSKSEQYGVTLRQPWWESVNTEVSTSLTLDNRRSQTFLLNRPFTLSAGAVDGETRVSVLRLALEVVNRSQKHVLALRSTLNLGINEFEATRHVGMGTASGTGAGSQRRTPDGQFFSWLGQGQYVRRLFDTDNLAVIRVNAQLTNDPLLSLEQYSLGGAQSVRGYRENLLLRDNGVFASIEARIPVWRGKAKNPLVTLAPFFDFGIGWDRVEFLGAKPPKNTIDDRTETLASVGLGVLFTPSKYVTAQLYWGYAINQKNTFAHGENLQDYGLHFTLTVNAF